MNHWIYLICIFLLSLIIISCQKEDEPEEIIEPVESSDWREDYEDAGTLDDNNQDINPIIDTKWILRKYMFGYAIEYPDDTIHFINNNDYRVNSNVIRNYHLINLPLSTNYDLTLNYFYPFGGSHYSAQVGQYFVEDGEINNAVFKDLQGNDTIVAWFEKYN